ncbi:MAG TPA: DUF6603 domain-containing protein, partial [Cyclobacteriaceae bacterium]|nr:DUF6603 domain-containing protein [Cyclobacteriaceae bacterium]
MNKDLHIFSELFFRFFRPVILAASDVSKAKLLVRELGYLPPDEFGVFESLDARIDGIKELIETMRDLSEDDLEDPEVLINTIKEGVESVTALIDELKNISSVLESELAGSELLAQTDILEKLPKKLYDLLSIVYIKKYHNKAYTVLKLFGVIEITEIDTVSNPFHSPHIERIFHWEKMGSFITSPLDLLKDSIRNNDEYFYNKLLQLVQEVGLSVGVYPHYEGADIDILKFINNNDPNIENWEGLPALEILRFPLVPSLVNILSFDIYPLIDTSANKFNALALVLMLDPTTKEIEINDQFKLVLQFTGVANGLGVKIDGDNEFSFVTDLFDSPQSMAANVQFDFRAKLTTVDDDKNKKLFQIGVSNGNRLEFGSFNLSVGIEKKEDARIFVEAELLRGLIVLRFDEADGFISKILGKGIESSFDMGVGFSNSNGFYFTNSSGLEIDIPTHIQLGPLEICNLQLSVKSDEEKITSYFAASILVTLGPLKALINNIGISFPGKSNGEANFTQLDFKPPTGVGLTVDAGGIKGGGILDFEPDKEEYFGALELEFKDLFSLKAFGIINTRLPDGTKGFSLLIIVTAEFNPIQLGLGFTLNGVGGLLGVHRTAKVEALKEGIKTNTLKSILFPENVVANIDRIVSDIKQVFPPLQDHFLICPMG